MAVNMVSAMTASQLRSYFNKRLLEYAVPNFKWAADALKSPLPAKMGSNSNITWFRWASPSSGNVVSVTEGTTPTARTTLTLSTVTASLSQYGEIVEITDLLSAQELFNTVDQGTRAIGEDCALHLDTLTRAAVIDSSVSANNVFAGAATAMASVTAAGQFNISAIDFLEAATNLKNDNAPTINGYYHAIVGPDISYDIMAATATGEFVDVNKYTTNTPILDAEIGRLYGVRIKESTIPIFTSTSAAPYTYSTTAAAYWYPTPVYGRDAYGIADLSSQSPYAPSINIVTGADKDDPLNQRTLIGWKSFFAAKSLNAAFTSLIFATCSRDT